jgi:hypothetical protein
MRAIREDGPETRFALSPARSYLLRDYSNDNPDDLTVLRDLIDEILTDHKFLIPGSMNRLVNQWRADLNRAIQAQSKKDEDKHPSERPAS